MKKIMILFFAILIGLSLGRVQAQTPDIASVKGENVYESTRRAVDLLGGMQRFVKPGQTVGILVNSGFREKGAYVDPDVVIAAIKMVFDAGASDIVFLQYIDPEYWTRSPLEPKFRDMIGRTRAISQNRFPSVFIEEFFVKVPTVEGAVSVKDLELVKEFFEVDVLLTFPLPSITPPPT